MTKGGDYLFSHKALAKVFRAKFLAALGELGLLPAPNLPRIWVVDCKCVGTGEKALVYLGRYLYRGVIQEKDILRVKDGLVTYRWRDSKTGKMAQRPYNAEHMLALRLNRVNHQWHSYWQKISSSQHEQFSTSL